MSTIRQTRCYAKRRQTPQTPKARKRSPINRHLRIESLEQRWLLAADFGDAPATFLTLAADGGAEHTVTNPDTDLRLGALVDTETDALVSANALGDDLDNLNDEDGISSFPTLAAGGNVTLSVEASAAGKLDAWIDFDGNGTFDVDEHINGGTSLDVTAGTNTIPVNIPEDALAGETFARFRLSSAGGLGPGGLAADGEVEDYQITINPSLIVDNTDATVNVDGSWTSSTGVSGFFGSDYLYDNQSVSGDEVEFDADIAVDGKYQVFARWTAHPNRATNALIAVDHADGQFTTRVNQQTSGGAWVPLGEFNFTALSDATVTVSDDGANGVVIADAVGFVRVGDLDAPPPPSGEIIVDNADSNVEIQGSWAASSGVSGFFDTNYLYDVDGTGSTGDTVSFFPAVSTAGTYEVFARWTAHPNRASNAQVLVNHADGQFSTRVNQQTNGGVWVSLGEFEFDSSTQAQITVTDNGANGYVVADAVRLVLDGDAPPPPPPSEETIIDNDDAVGVDIQGSWAASTGVNGFFDSDYLYTFDTTANTGDQITFSTNLGTTGSYEVFGRWTAHPNRTDNALFLVNHANGTFDTRVNQQTNGGTWVSLGNFDFEAEQTASVTVSDQGATGYVVADAVRFVLDSPVSSGEIAVFNGSAEVVSGGTVDLGTTEEGDPVQTTLEVRNEGSTTLNLTDIEPASLGADVSLVSNLSSTTLAPGESAHFTLQLDATTAGTVDTSLEIANSDLDENPFVINLTGEVTETALGEVQISPVSGLVTTEAGGQATFDVVLSQLPSADVSFNLTSSNTGEVTVSDSSLTFTSANWDTAQTVTLTGVDDNEIDGDVEVTIFTSLVTSADTSFDGVNPPDVTVTNLDDDDAGLTVTPANGSTTTEIGGIAEFNLVLDAQPTADVTFALQSSDETEVAVSPSSITFTSDNWNEAQTVIAVGVDDEVVDGDVTAEVEILAAVSADANFSGLDPDDITVVNLDDDEVGVNVSPGGILVTTEAGSSIDLQVSLNSEPTDDVTIPVSVSDSSELSVSVSSLTFTSANWSTPQTITVTGQDDALPDGDVTAEVELGVAASADANYNGFDPDDITFTNLDDEVELPGITVTPTEGLVTTEAGGTAQFKVRLNAEPTGDVTIDLSSSDTTEATLSTNQLTFTTSNWADFQTVIVTGVDDNDPDGNASVTIETAAASSTDLNYNGVDPSDVEVLNLDDEPALADFNGIYTGSFSGTVSLPGGGTTSVSGDIEGVVSAGAIIVVIPGSGSGTIDANGDISFAAVVTGAGTCDFEGSADLDSESGEASGTFSCDSIPGGGTASGTWQVTEKTSTSGSGEGEGEGSWADEADDFFAALGES